MKHLDTLTDFFLLLSEDDSAWTLKIRYAMPDSSNGYHERYFLSFRQNIRRWKILDNAIAFILKHPVLQNFSALEVRFESGLFLTTEIKGNI